MERIINYIGSEYNNSKDIFRAQTGDNWSLSQCPKISRIIITG